jgi:hypothetical protein
MPEHSETAARFGLCECCDCVRERGGLRHERVWPPQALVPEHWFIWTLRSWDRAALEEHRLDMYSMGYDVDGVRVSQGWAQDALPRGMHFFQARAPRSWVSDKHVDALLAWDSEYGGWNPDDPADQEFPPPCVVETDP